MPGMDRFSHAIDSRALIKRVARRTKRRLTGVEANSTESLAIGAAPRLKGLQLFTMTFVASTFMTGSQRSPSAVLPYHAATEPP